MSELTSHSEPGSSQLRHQVKVEPEDEQAEVYEALRRLEARLRELYRDLDRDPQAIAALTSTQAELRRRLADLSEEVRTRSIQAAEEEQARLIAKIILR